MAHLRSEGGGRCQSIFGCNADVSVPAPDVQTRLREVCDPLPLMSHALLLCLHCGKMICRPKMEDGGAKEFFRATVVWYVPFYHFGDGVDPRPVSLHPQHHDRHGRLHGL